ncbi:MAG: C1 family peptidase [Candidatus Thermoplasmatota archaeon]|nr:C1 family peptidase [Candidatus Thermoplasmatota archaeon]
MKMSKTKIVSIFIIGLFIGIIFSPDIIGRSQESNEQMAGAEILSISGLFINGDDYQKMSLEKEGLLNVLVLNMLSGGYCINNCCPCLQGWSNEHQDAFSFSNVAYGLGCIQEEIISAETLSGLPPDSWDWRNHQIMTPVKDQGRCGSCSAFGSLGALEAVIRREDGRIVDLSEAHVFFCSGRECSEGMGISTALYFLKDNGVCTEWCFPYGNARYGNNLPCDPCSNWEANAEIISEWKWVIDQNSIKNALVNYGPLICDFLVYSDFYDYWKEYPRSGIVYSCKSDDTRGFHCVTLVGYDDDPGYWICKNSWGTNGGDKGYFYIAYGECQIDSKAAFLSYKTPVAIADGPYKCYTYESIIFDGTKSYNPYAMITSYLWDFGDGNISYEPSPNHIYTRNGTYQVTLTVQDSLGKTAIDETTAVVSSGGVEITAHGGIGITVNVKNTGKEKYNFPLSIKVDGGTFINNVTSSMIDIIPLDASVNFKSKFLFGVGKIQITLIAGEISFRTKGFICGPLIYPIKINLSL